MAIVAAQYAYMVSSDLESPEVRYMLGPYTPADPVFSYTNELLLHTLNRGRFYHACLSPH